MARLVKQTNLLGMAFIFVFLSACAGNASEEVVPDSTILPKDTATLPTTTPPLATLTSTPGEHNLQEITPTLTPTVTPTTRPTEPSSVMDFTYPADTHTGIEEIDLIIDAIVDFNIEERVALVQYLSIACTITQDALGGPPKCDTEEDGTIVEVFPVLHTSGVYVRPAEIEALFDFSVKGLLMVYSVPDDVYSTDDWPAGVYGVVFVSEDAGYPQVITAFVEGGKIVRLDFDMIWPGYDPVEEAGNEFVLPPLWKPES